MKNKSRPKPKHGRAGNTYGPNELTHTITCTHCKQTKKLSRPDALYCSQACRSAAARARKIAAAIIAATLEMERARQQLGKGKKRAPRSRQS